MSLLLLAFLLFLMFSGLPAIEDIPGIGGVPAVAGVSSIFGVLASTSVSADPVVHIIAGVCTVYILYCKMKHITLIEKKIKFSSYIRKFRRELLQSHIYVQEVYLTHLSYCCFLTCPVQRDKVNSLRPGRGGRGRGGGLSLPPSPLSPCVPVEEGGVGGGSGGGPLEGVGPKHHTKLTT
jgi:hypothetical protein